MFWPKPLSTLMTNRIIPDIQSISVAKIYIMTQIRIITQTIALKSDCSLFLTITLLTHKPSFIVLESPALETSCNSQPIISGQPGATVVLKFLAGAIHF